MQKPSLSASFLAASALSFSALALTPATAAEPVRTAEIAVQPAALTFEAGAAYDHLRLTLGVPDGSVLERRVEAADSLSLAVQAADGQALPDGLYAYELRAASEPAGEEVLLRAGFFSIRDGAFVSPDVQEDTGPGAQAPSPGGPRLAAKDQVISDDLIVQGSECLGLDCRINEAFGFDTLRLKENNTRIKFEDTSTSAGFPSTDWQLTANDSASGGANRFSIENVTSAAVPLTVLGSAPTNSLFVGDQGRVGLGTSAPALQLQIRNGNTPGVRLEQDESGGFNAQSWDVEGNEVNFFVRDVTHGFALPLRIRAGAPTNSLVVSATGDVGLGTALPAARLDVVGDVAVSGTVDGRDVSADGSALDAHLADFDNPHQVTAAQAGADPEGAAAAAVSAHEAAFDHGNIPSALPVPIAEGGTGASDAASARANLGIPETKAGVVAAASFGGNPATATVVFASPYPAGTSYVVLLTAQTSDAKKLTTANVLVRDETGFTLTLGDKVSDLVEVDWLARPVGE